MVLRPAAPRRRAASVVAAHPYERSVLPNVGPSERRLKPRDVCRVEIFSVIDGYQAGVCRTPA